MDIQAQLETAIEITQRTGDILVSYVGSDRIDIRSKGPRDLVTAADVAAETYVLGRLRESFHGDGIVAEEGTDVDARTGRTWYLDPLDGTMNFARGLPIWCVSLALFECDRPLIGVIHDPLRNETFSAARGLGARLNNEAVHCSNPGCLSDAFVHVTVDFNDQSMLEGLEDIQKVAPRVMRTRNIGSAALSLAYLACGRLDAMLHRSAHVWDYAAGVVIIGEAGGVVTDMRGQPFSPSTVSLIAGANAAVHASLLELIVDRAELV